MESTEPHAAHRFGELCDDFDSGHVRSDVSVARVNAPTGIAPYAAAWRAEITAQQAASGQGRLALAYDPASPESWGGTLRAILFLTVPFEPAVAQDALLSEVAWSWLTDSLDHGAPSSRALAGTVSKTFNTGFGSLASDREGSVLEIRASWTPMPEELSGCRTAWAQTLALCAGLPPEEPIDGVTPLVIRGDERV